MSEQQPASSGGGKRDVVIAAAITAVVGAIATIIAALIGHAQGKSEASPGPTVTTTTSVTAAPTVTVTVTPSAAGNGGTGGGTSPASFPGAGQGGKVTTISVPLDPNSGNGIELNTAGVLLGSPWGDLTYQTSNDGDPEIINQMGNGVSTDITRSKAGEQGCQAAVNSDPSGKPIANFHVGLLICAVSNNARGTALLEQIQPLGAAKTLHLREIYWPSSNQ